MSPNPAAAPLGPRHIPLALAVPVILLLAACASAGRLGEYDFRDRTLGVTTTAPPHPHVDTAEDLHVDRSDPVGTILRAGTAIVRDVEAQRAGQRMDSALHRVDVSGRLADRVLADAARQLRARPVETVSEADFELVVRIQRYGIEADDWDSQARFFLEAEVSLLDAEGRRIWRSKVRDRDAIGSSVLGGGGAVGNVVTARALAALSTEEIARALESLADYSADRISDKLRKGLERVRD